jgi:hypothetical protein
MEGSQVAQLVQWRGKGGSIASESGKVFSIGHNFQIGSVAHPTTYTARTVGCFALG